MTCKYNPAMHTLLRTEVVPGHTGRGAKREIFGHFARIEYSGDPIRDFNGTRIEVLGPFDTEAEAIDKIASL
jgi:hypothetical protein